MTYQLQKVHSIKGIRRLAMKWSAMHNRDAPSVSRAIAVALRSGLVAVWSSSSNVISQLRGSTLRCNVPLVQLMGSMPKTGCRDFRRFGVVDEIR